MKISWNNFKKYSPTVVSETSLFKITLIELNSRVNGKWTLCLYLIAVCQYMWFFAVLEIVSPLFLLDNCFGLDQHNGQFFISADNGKEKNTDEKGLVERSLIVQNSLVLTPIQYQTQAVSRTLWIFARQQEGTSTCSLWSLEHRPKFVCMNQGLPC